jgi:rare lipoprotein A
LQNNLTTIVIINDRGPFVPGRVIDLSRAAAEQIGMIQQGVVEVEITIIE